MAEAPYRVSKLPIEDPAGTKSLADKSDAPQHGAEFGPRRKSPTVSWYGKLLIISTLLVAGGWEFFRLIIAILTLD